MKMPALMVSFAFTSTLLTGAVVAASPETRFFHEPSLCHDRIVFVHADDLWTVSLAGGKATQLTSSSAIASRPSFSPDCASIAFSAEWDGNIDVYLVAASGGTPRRLTWHPSPDLVEGWSPDGARILFTSQRVSHHFRPQLMTISASGGHPDVLPMHKAFRGAFSPDGGRLAYTPMRDAFRTWKRYRGGETTPIWIVDLQDYSHVEVPHQNASDTAPVWLEGSIYFLSDRHDVMSIYRYDVASATVERVADNGDADIDALSGSGGNLVYASEGYLYTYDVATRRSRRLPISLEHESAEIIPGPRNVAELIRSAMLSPDGSKVLLEVRGELVVLPRDGHTGDAVNVTRSSGSAERHPAWSPDGKEIAYFSDADGEYGLYVRDASGEGSPTRLGVEWPGYFYRPTWSPDGRKIVYIDKFRKLWWTDLHSRKHTRIESFVQPEDPYVWTPDSRGLVYANYTPTGFRELTLHELESGQSRRLTHPMGEAHQPVFSRDGRYLFFLGSTDVGQVKTGLDLSVIPHQNEVTWSVYAVLLRADQASPFALPADVEPPAYPVVSNLRIDWDGAVSRIVRLPVPAGRYVELRSGFGDTLFLRELPSERTFAGAPKLRRFDWRQRKLLDHVDNVQVFDVSPDGQWILYRSEGSWHVVSTAGTPAVGTGKLDVSGLQVHVEPQEEWRQIFKDVWRGFRDFFYDDKLHGVDWRAVRARYEAFLCEIHHRSDLDYVLRHMLGELVNSHITVRGPRPSRREPVNVGLLGADFTVSEDRYRIERIIPSTHWDDQASPLSVPGANVKEGDYILEVNGRELRHPTSLYSLFVGTAGEPVSLLVGASTSLESSRQVTVVPLDLEGEALLRRRAWVERNRQWVDERSGGGIAYVYQPDTGRESLREFNRLFFPQSDRAAVLIDGRFNDGGGDPDYQLDILNRQQVHWYARRDLPPFKSPFSMVAGPRLMLINAEAGSGGDVYPYQFTIRQLGTTVGTRTWGGVAGGGAGAPLVDGGVVRVPDLGTYAPDGSYILENSGFTPEVEVQVFPVDDFQGRDPQLEKAVEILMEQLQQNPPPNVPRLEKVHRALVRPSS